jgi:PAS domain S-box-containing protein
VINQEIVSKLVEVDIPTSEIELQALFAAMDNFIFVFDRQGHHLKTVATNPALLEGLAPEERRQALRKFLPLAHEQPFLSNVKTALRTKQTIEIEYSLVVDQKEVFFEASLSPVQRNSVIWMARDVTERKQAELSLKESEERFRSYFNLPLVGIAITSPEKGWLDVNTKACEMLGYTRQELTQLTWSELTHPEDLILDIELFDKIMSGEIEQYSMDKRYFRKDGVMIYTNLGVGCVRKSDGSVDYTVALMQDITERKQAEDALRRSEEELRKKAKELEQTLRSLRQTQAQLIQTEKMSSLGQLVAGIAHEINNPVNFINGNINHVDEYVADLTGVLQRYQESFQPTPEIQAEMEEIELNFLLEDLPKVLNSMKIGVDRIRQIVLSLRNFSRLDEAEIKSVDIHEGIDSTLLILQSRLKAKPDCRGIQIVKEYGHLPKIECYPGQLNQVFMNLLTNAIDTLEDSSQRAVKEARDTELQFHQPTIWIQTKPVNDRSISVHIVDNGLGMTEETRRRLFEPFFTTKPVGKGTGLGLSISYQIIVEKHGGKLECFSIPGKGTEFIIHLPILQQDQQPNAILPTLKEADCSVESCN